MKAKRIIVEVKYVKHCVLLDGPGWRVRQNDASMHTTYFAAQRFAIDFARDTCHRRQREGDLLELVVKTKVGNRIRYRDTYGNDPPRSKG